MTKLILNALGRAVLPAVILVYLSRYWFPVPEALLVPIVFVFLTVALLPTAVRVAKNALRRSFDVGASMLLTIYLLVYLNSLAIACIFVLIIIAGDFFKDVILYKVRESLDKITVYLPHTGFIKAADGKVREVDIEKIKVGDIVTIKPGQRSPVDGTLLAEEAILDESVITGESKPIPVEKGAEVPAGAINAGDYFEMAAKRVSADSTIAQIRKIAEEAEKQKTPIARFIDQYAKYTSLATAVLVAVLYVYTGDVFRALGLWIAMVPIVFAIIGPISVSIGISTAARLGILVKNSEVIEDLAKIKYLVFDKTGTLTIGQPKVRDILVADQKYSADALLALVAGLEKKSEHEIGKAIVEEAEKRALAVSAPSEVHVVKGGGLDAVSDGKKILVGSRNFLAGSNVSAPADFANLVAERERRGETPVFIAVDGKFVGGIFVADALRPETPKAISELKKQGYDLRILTGDERPVANFIASTLGLDDSDVEASLTPQGKIDKIEALEKSGRRAAMVGDGINDAPALSASTVGIAMGVRGTDLATNAANIVLVQENFLKIPSIIAHSKRIIGVIKQDLVSATVIHVLAGALSAFGIITLVQTALFHEASSVIVLLNTARLFRIKKENWILN
ncbi:MAG: cation-translocating P-type ATPase [Patescibacteria group bacterium]|nr:cation-translocating P-type ATPase [Patescibacteria group bacterium]